MSASSDENTNHVLVQLQGVYQSWLAFNLSDRATAEIKQTLLCSKEAQKLAVQARKELSDTTKQFKKCIKALEQQDLGGNESIKKAVDGVGKNSRTTVKSYQDGIDNLVKRCKASENAYSTLANSLLELPDPAVCLQASVEQITAQQNQLTQVNRELETVEKSNQQLKQKVQQQQQQQQQQSSGGGGGSGGGKDREELVQLRREVAEYEVEFRSLKNQDITIRKLETKIAELQQSAQADLETQLSKAKEELEETQGRRVAECLEREAALERKLQSVQLELQAERAGRQASQSMYLDADEGLLHKQAAWEAQKKILLDDGERLREQLQLATSERDELRLQVAAVQQDASSSGSRQQQAQHGGHSAAPPSGGVSRADLLLERKAYEAEVGELSETVTHFREELRVKDEGFAQERRQYQAQIEALDKELAAVNANLQATETQLASAPSQALVENMKRELRILKRLEYNAADEEDDAADNFDSHNPEIAGINEDEVVEKDLESVLVAKLRRAESDLVTERRTRSELKAEIESHKKDLAAAQKSKDDAEKLVSSLEHDLEKAIASTTAAAPTPSGTSSPKKQQPDLVVTGDGAPSTLQSLLDPSAVAGDDEEAIPVAAATPVAVAPTPETPSSSAAAVEKAQDDHSVATIIMAQRDRLRARCEALEAERDSFKRELQAQVNASESLKADNTKLYEKVRYLQNYNNRGASSTGNRGSAYNRSNSLNQERDLDLEALEQRYEASVDPFRQFSRAERQRKLQEMSPVERTVFIVAKTFLGSKEMRTALFFYVLVMHLLVFVTTYHWSHTGGCHNHYEFDHEQLAHLPPELPPHVAAQAAAAAAGAGAGAAAAGGG